MFIHMADNGWCSNVYALFAVPWMHQLESSAVPVFLTESKNVLILATSRAPLPHAQDWETPWFPILAHTKVSVYLTGFRNTV